MDPVKSFYMFIKQKSRYNKFVDFYNNYILFGLREKKRKEGEILKKYFFSLIRRSKPRKEWKKKNI